MVALAALAGFAALETVSDFVVFLMESKRKF